MVPGFFTNFFDLLPPLFLQNTHYYFFTCSINHVIAYKILSRVQLTRSNLPYQLHLPHHLQASISAPRQQDSSTSHVLLAIFYQTSILQPVSYLHPPEAKLTPSHGRNCHFASPQATEHILNLHPSPYISLGISQVVFCDFCINQFSLILRLFGWLVEVW